MSGNRIAKNTIYLYIRSFFVLLVSLYTSRVILDKLGADDYGLYNTVGSITASLSFLTASLSLATSRFLTYDLGKGQMKKLKSTFSNIFTLYIILAIIIIICLESVGPWFINNKLVFDDSRATAVMYVFHISVATVFISLLSTPFSSLIIAHEDMSIYSFVGVFEAISKLAICYAISTTSLDKLVFYSCLILLVHLILTSINIVYSKMHYDEVTFNLLLQRKPLKSIANFACWSLIGRFGAMLQLQGINIITNMFFGPAIVAARALSIQVDRALQSFVGNFMTAVNPQILKRHAADDDNSSYRLVQKSTVFSFILASFICVPVIINTDYILSIWLKDVPDYSVPFVQIILIQSIFGTIENGMYSVFYSRGRVKENSLISPFMGMTMFVVVYYLFKMGFSPLALSYCYLLNTLLSCMIVKPLLIHKLFRRNLDFFLRIDIPCIKLILSIIPLIPLHSFMFGNNNFVMFVIETVVIFLYMSIVTFSFVLNKDMRMDIVRIMKENKKLSKLIP